MDPCWTEAQQPQGTRGNKIAFACGQTARLRSYALSEAPRPSATCTRLIPWPFAAFPRTARGSRSPFPARCRMTSSSSQRNPLEQLAEEFAQRQRRGEQPSLTEYTDKYPQWADQIRELFPALVL